MLMPNSGDKSMHIAVLHLPQLYYFSVFSAAFVFPFLLDGQVISRTVRSLIGSPTYKAPDASLWQFSLAHVLLGQLSSLRSYI